MTKCILYCKKVSDWLSNFVFRYLDFKRKKGQETKMFHPPPPPTYVDMEKY